MVNIAVAGGSGEVAREIIDALVAAEKHEITILSRKEAPTGPYPPGISWRVVNYNEKSELIAALSGIHTVLSFIQLLTDPENKSQKNLIDASVSAGVKRFAPSEWGSSGTVDMPWWTGKASIRSYLQEINSPNKVLEYTLFQPGLFLNYLAAPHKTARHLTPLNMPLDFAHRRAICVAHADPVLTLTTVQDLAAVVARAVNLPDPWPVVGGVCGASMPVSRILEVGARVRGRPFSVEVVEQADLERGELHASWMLETKHPSYAGGDVDAALKSVLVGMLLSSAKGAWVVSDEFNRLLPDYKFTQVEEFLAEVWEGKP